MFIKKEDIDEAVAKLTKNEIDEMVKKVKKEMEEALKANGELTNIPIEEVDSSVKNATDPIAIPKFLVPQLQGKTSLPLSFDTPKRS